MNREKAREALRRLESNEYPSNKLVIAECIRMELAEARERDLTAVEAEAQVAQMLAKEFIYARVITPFKIDETLNFLEWSVEMRYPTGESFKVTHAF